MHYLSLCKLENLLEVNILQSGLCVPKFDFFYNLYNAEGINNEIHAVPIKMLIMPLDISI
jgi:hypothetical protein